MQVRGGFLAQPSCRSGPKVQLFLLTAVDFCSFCLPAALGEHRVSLYQIVHHYEGFTSLHHKSRLPDPTALRQAPYHPDSGFARRHALVITCCRKLATFFSKGTAVAGTGTDMSSSNQQSCDRAVLISFYSLFMFGVGTPSEKPTDPGRAGAPAGRHPRLICTPN